MKKQCLVCHKEIEVPECLIGRKKFCSIKCRGFFYRGTSFSPDTQIKKGQHLSLDTQFKKGENLREKHPNWNGGRWNMANGYVAILNREHPRVMANGYVYEHILVAEKKYGRPILSSESVHHLNGRKDDNRPDNIVICQSDAEHRKYHVSSKWSRKYDKCIKCMTTNNYHAGKGLCHNCYQNKRHHDGFC